MEIIKTWGDASQVILTKDEVEFIAAGVAARIGFWQEGLREAPPPCAVPAFSALGDIMARMSRCRTTIAADSDHQFKMKKQRDKEAKQRMARILKSQKRSP